MVWYFFLRLLIILSDGVVAENLVIEPTMNIIMDYLKNVTQGVAMVLTKIDGENRGKYNFTVLLTYVHKINLEKYPWRYNNMFPVF